MVSFYDPKDGADLARVEKLLEEGGIEFHTSKAPGGAALPVQIEVAEEDLPKAEELLALESNK